MRHAVFPDVFKITAPVPAAGVGPGGGTKQAA
jgi:hypothetical protein